MNQRRDLPPEYRDQPPPPSPSVFFRQGKYHVWTTTNSKIPAVDQSLLANDRGQTRSLMTETDRQLAMFIHTAFQQHKCDDWLKGPLHILQIVANHL